MIATCYVSLISVEQQKQNCKEESCDWKRLLYILYTPTKNNPDIKIVQCHKNIKIIVVPDSKDEILFHKSWKLLYKMMAWLHSKSIKYFKKFWHRGTIFSASCLEQFQPALGGEKIFWKFAHKKEKSSYSFNCFDTSNHYMF